MPTCSACDQPARAKGLCVKHYNRLRRHGNPNIRKKPGKSNPDLDLTRGLMTEWSPSNQRKFARAFRLCADHLDEGDWEQLIKLSTRPNGSINVSKLFESTETRATMRFLETHTVID